MLHLFSPREFWAGVCRLIGEDPRGQVVTDAFLSQLHTHQPLSSSTKVSGAPVHTFTTMTEKVCPINAFCCIVFIDKAKPDSCMLSLISRRIIVSLYFL